MKTPDDSASSSPDGNYAKECNDAGQGEDEPWKEVLCGLVDLGVDRRRS